MARPYWKVRLEPFSEAYASIFERLNDMPLADLLKLKAACKLATPTNCAWSTYHVARLIAPELDWHIADRQRQARKAVSA